MASVIRIRISKVAGQTSGIYIYIYIHGRISIYMLIIYINHVCIMYIILIYIIYSCGLYTRISKRRPLSLVNSKRVEVRNTIYFTAGPSAVMGFHDIYIYS